MKYIVSARKYRPDSFASIVGQSAMATTLRRTILSNRLAHAYLFCGPRGVGKTTASRVLAKTINCMHLTPEGEACNECESCRSFMEGRSFNIFELDAASNNSVEDIRSLTAQVAMPPAVGRYKVYIIDEVHMLSAAAFNAFLKTLEEPPSYAIFILATTEKHKILPTILSRCQIYDFKRITVLDIVDHLRYVSRSEGIEAEEDALGLIAEKADGGMRDALSMFDRIASFSSGHITYQAARECLNVLDYSYFIKMIEAMRVGDYRSLLLLLDELLSLGFDGQLIVGGLGTFVRDLLVAQHADTLRLLDKPESVARLYRDLATQLPTSTLYQSLKLLVTCEQQYRLAPNKRLAVELVMLSLVQHFSQASTGETGGYGTTLGGVQSTPTSTASSSSISSSHVHGSGVNPTVITTATGLERGGSVNGQSIAQQRGTTMGSVLTHGSPGVVSPPTSNPNLTPAQEESQRARARFRPSAARRMRSGQSEETSVGDVVMEVAEEKDFTEEDLQKLWLRFCDEELTAEDAMIQRMLQNGLPHLTESYSATFEVVDTTIARQQVEAIIPRLISYLRTKLHNGKLSLVPYFKELEREGFILTKGERLAKLVEEYPNVGKLASSLNLRLN